MIFRAIHGVKWELRFEPFLHNVFLGQCGIQGQS
jgi:hypothetical protein